ncbi:MAG: FAD-binding oxidoreductase [Tabrizicola sp.]|nr:FAD-binding oxidoreductase [Tabrizicola sp.]
MSIQDAKAALAHLEIDDNPVSVKAKSRDFFWYSPVLKARLDHLSADFVVAPKTEVEVIEVLRTAFAHDIPVTTRGAGTGNYGQAMPLAGGIVMHMKNLSAVKSIHPGRVIVEPGCLIRDLDAATRAHSGQELRMHPSTYATATIGGFVGGGSGGIGSCSWGVLRDLGNILRLRVVTMEAAPRILEFTGEELHRVSHAYGTNGIITELEMPLAPAYDWVDLFVTLPDFPAAVAFAGALGHEDGILKKLISVYEAPTAHAYFQRVAPHVSAADHLLGLMVAPHSMDGFLTFLARFPGARLIYRSDLTRWPKEPGPVFEYGWNHTTLRALKVDPAITYLQVLYDADHYTEKIEAIRRAFPGELIQHLEAMRVGGRLAFAGLTLVKFTSEARLDEIIRQHEAMGCFVFNPHRYTLEEGGRQSVDDTQLAFKREADPKGLLNPGKMIAWDDPGFAYDRIYAYPGMQGG